LVSSVSMQSPYLISSGWSEGPSGLQQRRKEKIEGERWQNNGRNRRKVEISHVEASRLKMGIPIQESLLLRLQGGENRSE